MVHWAHSLLESDFVSSVPDGPARECKKFSILPVRESFLEDFLGTASLHSRKPTPLRIRSPSHLQVSVKENSMCTIFITQTTILTEGRSGDFPNGFRFVGKASLHARQTKFFTLLSTSIPHRFFQNSISLAGVCCPSELSFKNL